MPRVMYGKLHAFNNYFNAPGNLYCIGVGSFGTALVENNYFKDVKGPHVFMYDWHMYIAATGNVHDSTTGNNDTGMGGSRGTNDPALNAGVEKAAAFTPPYKYTLDAATKQVHARRSNERASNRSDVCRSAIEPHACVGYLRNAWPR